jgi:hypothetical protein
MPSISERLAAAIAGVPFVQLPEGWEGGPINIPGLTGGLPLDDPWDVLAHADAPGLSGDEVRFAVTADGRTISGGEASPDALQPLARTIGARLEAARASAVPDEGEVEIAGTATGCSSARRRRRRVGRAALGGDVRPRRRRGGCLRRDRHRQGDTAILANRFAGPVWVAEIYPL